MNIKEVWKLNFRQYGEMERAQPGRNSDVKKVRREKRRDFFCSSRCVTRVQSLERREKRRDGESQKRENAGAQVGKSRNTLFSSVLSGSGGSKGKLAKGAGAEVAGEMKDDKLHAVVGRSTFGIKVHQTHYARSIFGS